MAFNYLCDPCAAENKSLEAKRYCMECEERLCQSCTDLHARFKAFKSHHIVDVVATGNRRPPAKRNCENHEDVPVDFYCVKHHNCLCVACIPLHHRFCDTVIPLESAANDVKTSPLFVDTLKEYDNIIKTLEELLKERESSQSIIDEKESSILLKVMDVKMQLLAHINVRESILKEELSTIKAKRSATIEKEKEEILNLLTNIKESREELEFFKDNCSDSQIFLALEERVKKISQIGNQIEKVIANASHNDIEFKAMQTPIDFIGSILETTRPCGVLYKPIQVAQAQVLVDITQTSKMFKKSGELTLKGEISYNITDIAVTPDDKLLLCNRKYNYSKIYSYKGVGYKDFDNQITLPSEPCCIAILSGSDRAVVTSTYAQTLHFINTTSMIINQSVTIGIYCYGVAASSDTIFVGTNNMIHCLNYDGSLVATINTRNTNNIMALFYKEDTNQLLCRSIEGVFSVEKHDKVNKVCQVDGETGLAVDHQGYIYLPQYNAREIKRLHLKDNLSDVVLTKPEGIDKPYCITFNNDCTKLMVVNRCQSVVIFTCNK